MHEIISLPINKTCDSLKPLYVNETVFETHVKRVRIFLKCNGITNRINSNQRSIITLAQSYYIAADSHYNN